MAIVDRLREVVTNVADAAIRAGRDPARIVLAAISKKQPLAALEEYADAAKALGVPVVFGENYVQELARKKSELRSAHEMHLTGPLQSNKTRDAVRLCDVIQTAQSLKIIDAIAREARAIGKRQKIFLQVNIGADPAKSGFAVGELSEAIARVVSNEDAIELLGLMTITPYGDDPETTRPYFRAMVRLREELTARGEARSFSGGSILLSMGMSADYPVAIEEGADLVRVGTAIFGERSLDSAAPAA